MIKYKVKNGNMYLQTFASDTKSDIVLLFLHGGLGIGAWTMIMQEAMQKLAKEYRCVFFDQRGSGLSFYELKDGISFSECMGDVVAIALDAKQRFDCKQCILCAEDIAGFFALQTNYHYDGYFDGMIFMNPILLLTSEASEKFYQMIKRNCIELGNPELKKLISILDSHTPTQFFENQYVHQWIYSDKNTSIPLRHIAAISKWLFDHQSEDAMRTITIPTLLMQGSDDMIAREGTVIDTLVRMKNPFIVYAAFPYSGNKIYEDHPLEFIDRIQRFLKEEYECISF